MQSFTVLCAKFLSILGNEVATDIMKYFPQNYMLKKCRICENFELLFRVAPKSICGLHS